MRIALGMACIVAGAMTISWIGTPTLGSFAGSLARAVLWRDRYHRGRMCRLGI